LTIELFVFFLNPFRITETEKERKSRRFYGGEVDGISRQLARYVHKTVQHYMPEMNPKMIYRLDRFGRGGHHRPFNDMGYAGVRIMEAHENYTQQHQDIRTENGINYGDVLDAVNFEYAKKLTAVNAINLAAIGWAPPSVSELSIGGIVEASVRFNGKKLKILVLLVIEFIGETQPLLLGAIVALWEMFPKQSSREL
jgi:hypothetical protein